MQIREHLGSYLSGCAATYDGNGEGSLEFIQGLMRQPTACGGPDVTSRELQMIPLAYVPCLEGSLWQNNAQGISHPSQCQFHRIVITCYNNSGKAGRGFVLLLRRRAD